MPLSLRVTVDLAPATRSADLDSVDRIGQRRDHYDFGWTCDGDRQDVVKHGGKKFLKRQSLNDEAKHVVESKVKNARQLLLSQNQSQWFPE